MSSKTMSLKEFTSRKICSIDSERLSRIKFPRVTNDGAFMSPRRYMYRMSYD